MIVYGYAYDYMYSGDGTLRIRVRIPSIHGPMSQRDYNGEQVRNYVRDQDLPYYDSVLLPHLPTEGEVVAVASTNETSSNFLVIGLTGGSYYNEIRNQNR